MTHLLTELNTSHEFDVPLGSLTWYGLGGRARILAHPADIDELAALVRDCHEQNIRTFVLGRGANLLVADEGVDGVVIRLDQPAFCRLEIDGQRVLAGAGFDLMKLVLRTAREGLGGFEGLAGIPATVGGAVRMNAGGSFGEIGPSVGRIQVMDRAGNVFWKDRSDLVFGYRSTNITEPYILNVEFELMPADRDRLDQRVKEVFRYKKASQPMADHSPGCAFKNPRQAPPQAHQTAGSLIDQAGLKGYREGGAYVSDRHANFIIADPGARAADVRAVLEHVEATVRDRFGVTLEREVVLWP